MRLTPLKGASPLYYRALGAGKPLVLLHGMGCDSHTWDPVRDRLARRWLVLTPDLPGHGGSPKPRSRYDYALYLQYLTRWLETLDLGPVHLVGHALGGTLAIRLALERPDLVRLVGAVSPVRLIDHRPPCSALRASLAFSLAQLAGRPSQAAVRRYLVRGFGTAPAAVSVETAARWQAAAAASTRAMFSTNRHLRQSAALLHDDASRIDCPVWLLWGRRDPLFPGADAVKHLAGRFASAQLDMLDTGHLPMIERPAKFCDRLEERLTKHARRLP